MQHTAIVRGVPKTIGEGLVEYLERRPIDQDLAEDEHAEYVRALAELGCRIIHLPPLDELPDSVFVEDTAVVVDEMAILTRPGAESRRAEVDSISPTLGEYRPLIRMKAPATLDGGDVLRVGRKIWVGSTSRTNAAGIAQL
ncbi:MAG: dimethylargininase, partial [Thermoanaerobaculia bacterium]|nr:dimethylargininase [Thermoanaerobaculia bacterium]